MSTLVGTKEAPRDLSRRSAETEWLDAADKSPDELAPVLRDIARFNGAMLGHWPVIRWLHSVMNDTPRGTELTLVDVGCGYGDLLRAIRRWARKHELTIKLIGIDLSRETIRIAQTATDDADDIDYRVMDVFYVTPPMPIDFVVSSLLTHHMSDELVVKFLRWMEHTARRGWMIYDLQRHVVPFHFIGLIGRLMRLHPMVIKDARISVARSLTRSEWLSRFDDAGIARDTVHLHWFLFRFVIGRVR